MQARYHGANDWLADSFPPQGSVRKAHPIREATDRSIISLECANNPCLGPPSLLCYTVSAGIRRANEKKSSPDERYPPVTYISFVMRVQPRSQREATLVPAPLTVSRDGETRATPTEAGRGGEANDVKKAKYLPHSRKAGLLPLLLWSFVVIIRCRCSCRS